MNAFLDTFGLISTILVSFCMFAIIVSVLINFAEGRKESTAKYKKNSLVETGTMGLFFVVFCLIIKSGIGQFHITSISLRIASIIFSLAILFVGCYINISGRLSLGKNWANQIRIYNDHTLATKGAYNIVRHPLYASLIWMFYAASVIYLNYAAFLANTFIFVPFMYYRAKQEEALLSKQFKNYKDYQAKTGMFFPKVKLWAKKRD